MFVIQSTQQGASFLTNHFLKYKIEHEFQGFYFVKSRAKGNSPGLGIFIRIGLAKTVGI